MLGIRWTIGDVSERGFEALRLSLWGAWRIFGASVAYRVLVNTIAVADARARTGLHPPAIDWQAADQLMPGWLRERFLDAGFAGGMAWKLAPIRCFPDDHELSLDNDVILWAQPDAIADWLADDHATLVAEDVAPSFGQFAERCGPAPRNAGIRGLPPGFDLEASMQAVLDEHPAALKLEPDDEQGLQVAALYRDGEPKLVRVADVTICSPFPPHLPHVGRCGAHFVGLNAHQYGWEYDGEPAERVRARHFDQHREDLHTRVGPPLARDKQACP